MPHKHFDTAQVPPPSRSMPIRAAAILCVTLAAAAYDITGVVVDDEGRAIADAQLWISQDRAVRTTTSDNRGRFSFPGVTVGPMELVARKDGYALGGAAGQVIDSADIHVVLHPPGEITLHIIDPQSQPLEGARLKALFIADAFHVPVEDLVAHGFPSLRSGEDGLLVIPDLPKGAYASFTIAHRTYAENRVPTLPVGAELDIRLPHGIRVRGRVTNQAGEPVVRARVSIYRANRQLTEVLTGPDGFYSAVIPTGQYNVAVRHLDYAIPDPQPLEWGPADDSAELNIVLPPPHVIRGSVVGPQGEPVPATKISYLARDIIFAEALSDIQGHWNITVASGQGFLHVTPPSRMVTVALPEIPFEIEHDREVVMPPIELDRLPELRGVITAPRGVPLHQIVVTTQNITPPIRAVTDSEGRFTIQLEHMPRDGQVQLRAEHALRFLRRDFTMRIARDRTASERLRPFEPDLAPAPAWSPNKMAHMVGKPAPEIACKAWFNLAGKQENLRLVDLRGKVVVLTFWGGWDNFGLGPNRIDELNTLHAIYEDNAGVAILNVHDASKSAEEVQQYIHQFDIPYPVGLDDDPFLSFDAYNVNAIPQTVLIDKQGILQHFHVDGRLSELIKDLLRR